MFWLDILLLKNTSFDDLVLYFACSCGHSGGRHVTIWLCSQLRFMAWLILVMADTVFDWHILHYAHSWSAHLLTHSIPVYLTSHRLLSWHSDIAVKMFKSTLALWHVPVEMLINVNWMNINYNVCWFRLLFLERCSKVFKIHTCMRVIWFAFLWSHGWQTLDRSECDY